MNINRLILVLSLVVACCLTPINSAVAQPLSNAENLSTLRATSTTKAPLHGALAGNARCDEDGNIYFLVLNAESSKQRFATARLPIQKMSQDGRLGVTFRIPDEPSDLLGTDFLVTADGSVYLAASRLPDQYAFVLKYSSTGEVKVIPLDMTRFKPRQIAVFRSGEILLSGTIGESNHTPFTAVFDPSGKLLKKIYEPEDEVARQKAVALDPDYVHEGQNADNTAVLHGDVTLGSDGNAYLLRATSPALIYVISSKGEVIRKLNVESPSSGLVAQIVKSTNGRLAVSFLGTHSDVGTTKILDLKGNALGQLDSDDLTISPGLPGCYSSGSFFFLHTDTQNQIYLGKAEPN